MFRIFLEKLKVEGSVNFNDVNFDFMIIKMGFTGRIILTKGIVCYLLESSLFQNKLINLINIRMVWKKNQF